MPGPHQRADSAVEFVQLVLVVSAYRLPKLAVLEVSASGTEMDGSKAQRPDRFTRMRHQSKPGYLSSEGQSDQTGDVVVGLCPTGFNGKPVCGMA